LSDAELIRRIVALEELARRPRAESAISGLFTPTYYGSTVPGVTTYLTQYGRHTLRDDVCTFWLRVDWSAVTGTGNGLVGGLPFVAAASSQSTFAIFSQNYAYTNAGLRAYMFGGNQFINIFDQVVGAFASAPIDAAGTLIISGAYPV